MGAVPLPFTETVCGLPAALSVVVSVAGRRPVAVGVNVTLMVQVNPGPRVAGRVPQVCV